MAEAVLCIFIRSSLFKLNTSKLTEALEITEHIRKQNCKSI